MEEGAAVLTAQKTADYFLSRTREDGDCPMTNLRLQGLLYYAQAWHLALTGRPLIGEVIQAWRHGPVVPSIYDRYKDCRWRRIPPPTTPPEVEDPEAVAVLEAVWNAYGRLSASQLQTMAHDELPWQEARSGSGPYENRGPALSRTTMRDYFRSRLQNDQERQHAHDRAAYRRTPTTDEERVVAEASLEMLSAEPA